MKKLMVLAFALVALPAFAADGSTWLTEANIGLALFIASEVVGMLPTPANGILQLAILVLKKISANMDPKAKATPCFEPEDINRG